MRKGAEGQVENESRRVMIPFYHNNTSAPSTREEVIIWMLHRMASHSSSLTGLCLVIRCVSLSVDRLKVKVAESPHHHVWQVAAGARSRVSHNLHSPVLVPVLLPGEGLSDPFSLSVDSFIAISSD